MPIDDKTPRLGLELPAQPNTLRNDVQRLRDALTELDSKVATRDANGELEKAQIPFDVARLDQHLQLKQDQIPDNVVTKDANGKIDSSLLEDEVVVNNWTAASETLMLDLPASLDDVAFVTSTNKTYILVKKPATERENWKEVVSRAVTSVNGYTGDVIVANVRTNPNADVSTDPMARSKGPNNNITDLQALSGPLTLGGDGTDDSHAVTVRQLKGAVGTSGGATMSGVMNNFIGSVEWFNGSRSALPAGYVPADGQILSRTKYPDLWAAINSGMLISVTDAQWKDSGAAANDLLGKIKHRASYSSGNGVDTFRVPDLNGMVRKGVMSWTGESSLAATFLCGDGGGLDGGVYGAPGQLLANAAPNITGTFASMVPGGHSQYGIGAFYGADLRANTAIPAAGYMPASKDGTPKLTKTGTTYKVEAVPAAAYTDPNKYGFAIDASRSSTAYGRAPYVRPNSAVGIWIIRASGSFVSANNKFEVINAYNPMPATGQGITGGFIQGSLNDDKGQTVNAVGMTVNNTVGGNPVGVFGVANYIQKSTGVWELSWKHLDLSWSNGSLQTPGDVNAAGSYTGAREIAGNTYKNGDSATGGGIWLNGLQNGTRRFQSAFYTELVWGGISRTMISAWDLQGNVTRYWFFNTDGTTVGPAGTFAMTASDIKLKENVEDADSDGLNRVLALQPKEFNWRNTGRRDRGFIAQDLQTIDPIYVFESEINPDTHETVLNVSDRALLADIVSAIQALKKENDDLRQQLAALKP